MLIIINPLQNYCLLGFLDLMSEEEHNLQIMMTPRDYKRGMNKFWL